MASIWWIVMTICFPLGEDSRDCRRHYVFAEDLGMVWEHRIQCDAILPDVQRATTARLEAAGWGAAWIDGIACEKAGQVM